MVNATKYLTTNLVACFLLAITGGLCPVFAQKLQKGYTIPLLPQNVTPGSQSTDSTPQSVLPPPVPRPGMSAYQPADYSDSMSTTQSDTITSQKGPGLPGSHPSQSPREPYHGPYMTIPGTGISAYFNAPVSPPYNASSTYDTYGGQPGGGRNAPLQQGAAGKP